MIHACRLCRYTFTSGYWYLVSTKCAIVTVSLSAQMLGILSSPIQEILTSTH